VYIAKWYPEKQKRCHGFTGADALREGGLIDVSGIAREFEPVPGCR
jgi:hypothetical protein